MQTFTCVPGVVTAGPREHSVEGGEEVEECPSQNDDVISHQVNRYHLNAVAQTY